MCIITGTTAQKPLEKKKSVNVIKDVPVKSFRQPTKTNTISTRQRFSIASQQVTTKVPTTIPFNSKSNVISTRQRFNIAKEKVTTEEPAVIPFNIKTNTISTRQRFNSAGKQGTTEVPSVIPFLASPFPIKNF